MACQQTIKLHKLVLMLDCVQICCNSVLSSFFPPLSRSPSSPPSILSLVLSLPPDFLSQFISPLSPLLLRSLPFISSTLFRLFFSQPPRASQRSLVLFHSFRWASASSSAELTSLTYQITSVDIDIDDNTARFQYNRSNPFIFIFSRVSTWRIEIS